MPTTLVLLAVVFVAFTIEASLGFGATLITVTLGMFLVKVSELLPAYVPVNMLLSTYLAVRYRQQIAWGFLFRRVVPLMAVGLPLGLWGAARVDESLLKRAFGAFVIVLSALELGRARPVEGAAPTRLRPFDALVLLVGGVVHGAFGTGGPMAVYVAGRTLTDKAVFRASLSLLWVVLNVVLVGTYAARGEIGLASLERSAGFAVALVAGIVVGEQLHRRVPAQRFRGVVFGMLLAAGAVLLLRG
ncbi:MAG: sulfite exporter TauE/SafE family protein [Minicystis sp.]